MGTLIETISSPIRKIHFATRALNARIEDRITIAKIRQLDDHMLRQFGLTRVEIETQD